MPPSLGQRLKHTREKRGLSLRDIEHTTRIPVARLQDLEEDKLNNFGGMTYAKAFLRTYATLLEVNAEEVLNQIKAPPLGGKRDYRYLVETQGRWLVDKRERYAPVSSTAPLSAGKSFLFASLVCLAFGLLIGGAVLANAYFNSKTAAAHAQDSTAAKSSGAAPESTSLATDASPAPDPLTTEPEFTVLRATVVSPGESVAKPGSAPFTSVPAARKAEPVIESPSRPLPPPPKAEAVR